ncbi:hypothetical protein [Thermococcus sp.]
MKWKSLFAVLLGLLMIGTMTGSASAEYLGYNWSKIKYATTVDPQTTVRYTTYNSADLELQYYIPPQPGIRPTYIFVVSTVGKSTASYGDPLFICKSEYIIQKLGGSKYLAILTDPNSLSYAGANPWPGRHDENTVKKVAYDSMSVALDLLNSYVATAKDIGQLMYDLAGGIGSKSNTQNYWDVKWNFCSFLGGWRGTNPTEVHTYFRFKVEVDENDPLFEIKLVSKINDNPDTTVTWYIMGDYPDYPRPISITSILPAKIVWSSTGRHIKDTTITLKNGVIVIPHKYMGNVIVEKLNYKGRTIEYYVILPRGLIEFGKELGIPEDIINHFVKLNRPLYLIRNPDNVHVRVEG